MSPDPQPPSSCDPLTDDELVEFVERVFAPRGSDRGLALLFDRPDERLPDHEDWRQRRDLARDWAERLGRREKELGMPVRLYSYRNVRTNNADLPPLLRQEDSGEERPTEEIFRANTLFLALTELSATAPLKVAAPRYDLRAGTMPGFRAAMLPALRIDAVEVDRRCRVLADLLSRASHAVIRFRVAGTTHRLDLDLRFRVGHSSGGLLRLPGTAGNVPSGESYIVPYEGERAGDPSGSRGTLPVQFEDGMVVYEVANNRVIRVSGEGPAVERERAALAQEPAYANLAELGLGVLGAFGIQPIGEVLLDEKLGPHIAFGRSDHFGGQVGPSHFSSPDRVVHIDRVYLPETQPDVDLYELSLCLPEGDVNLIRNSRWVLEL